MDQTFIREDRLQDNYGQVPNGLWTADLSYGAKCLLGWLHSHKPEYLARLSVNRIRDEFGGGGQVQEWLAELREAGYLDKKAVGQRHVVTLFAKPWDALCNPDLRGSGRKPTGRKPVQQPVGYRPVTAPETDPIEEQIEDQVEKTSSSSAPSVACLHPDQFDRFWKTYGNLAGTGKKKARECWNTAMKRGDPPADIIDGLEAWVAYWRTPGANKAMYAQGFLNQQKWMTSPPPLHRESTKTSRAMSPVVSILSGRNAADILDVQSRVQTQKEIEA